MEQSEDYQALFERYPFLRELGFENREYSLLDEMPPGWRTAFGEQLCAELKEELDQEGVAETYKVLQIKEKYGELRWYDAGNTERGYQIIEKYGRISRRTCIMCGKPATQITRGWISPYCDDCLPRGSDGKREDSVPVEEWCKDNEQETAPL